MCGLNSIRPWGHASSLGLHRAILSSAWGHVVSFTTYKALRQGKLVKGQRVVAWVFQPIMPSAPHLVVDL